MMALPAPENASQKPRKSRKVIRNPRIKNNVYWDSKYTKEKTLSDVYKYDLTVLVGYFFVVNNGFVISVISLVFFVA